MNINFHFVAELFAVDLTDDARQLQRRQRCASQNRHFKQCRLRRDDNVKFLHSIKKKQEVAKSSNLSEEKRIIDQICFCIIMCE